MSSSVVIIAFLLLVTLAIASPTTSLEATDPLDLMQQIAPTTSLILQSIPTISIDILQPPYVSLHSIAARDAPAPDPTTTPSLRSIVPLQTVTLKGHHEFFTSGLYTTSASSGLYHGTEVPVASSASCVTRVANTTQTKWDCTAICAALNEDAECSEVSACVKMTDGEVDEGRPLGLSVNSAGRVGLSSHYGKRFVAVMILVVGLWMLL